MAPQLPGPLIGPGIQLAESLGVPLHAELAERSVALRAYLDEWLSEQDRLLSSFLVQATLGNQNSWDIPLAEPLEAAPLPAAEEEVALVQTDVASSDPPLDAAPLSATPAYDSEESQPRPEASGNNWNPILERYMDLEKVALPTSKKYAREIFSGSPLAKRIEQSSLFNNATTGVIVCNVAMVALTTHVAASGGGTIHGLVHVELLFTLFYSLELLTRVCAHGFEFFMQDIGWRVFDTTLVFISVMEQFLRSMPAVSALRILRVLKVVKVLRVVRAMRSFEELRLILDSIMGSTKTLLWSLIVMVFVMFIFVVFFMQGATRADPLEGEQARAPWQSLGSGMCALFEAATGGRDWRELADPLYEDGLHFYAGFIIYIAFFSFVLMNSLTGMFVERVVQMVTCNETVMTADRLNAKSRYADRVRHLFMESDMDGDMELTYKELHNQIHNKAMITFAASLDIDEADLMSAFRIVTLNGTQSVNLDNFVTACIKLRGSAKSVDIINIHLMLGRMQTIVNKLHETHEEFCRHATEQFQRLHDKSDKLHRLNTMR